VSVEVPTVISILHLSVPHVVSTSTMVEQSRTVQMVAKDLSIWSTGPRRLLTFLLNSAT